MVFMIREVTLYSPSKKISRIRILNSCAFYQMSLELTENEKDKSSLSSSS